MGFAIDVNPPFASLPLVPLVCLIQATDLQLSSIFSLIFSPYPVYVCASPCAILLASHALSPLWPNQKMRAPATLPAEINPPEVYLAVKSLQAKRTEVLRARNKKQCRDPSKLLTWTSLTLKCSGFVSCHILVKKDTINVKGDPC